MYEAANRDSKLCVSCPAFVAKCAGSESGVHPEPEAEEEYELDSAGLKRMRSIVGSNAESYLMQAVQLAIRLGVLPPGRTIADLAAAPSLETQIPKSTDPKGLARMYMRSLAKNLSMLKRLHHEDAPVMSNCLGLMFLVGAQQNCVAGILASIDSTGRRTASAGAEGRRKIGANTRERVRIAAEGLRGRMSKEDAAVQIASSIGKGAATVRRILSSTFPGDSWRIRNDQPI